MTDRFSGEVFREFLELLSKGHHAAVVPFVDACTGDRGWSAAGIAMAPDGTITELALSPDRDDRAAAAIMVCTNVARSTERHDGTKRCLALTTASKPHRVPMRLLMTHLSNDHRLGPAVSFFRDSLGQNTP